MLALASLLTVAGCGSSTLTAGRGDAASDGGGTSVDSGADTSAGGGSDAGAPLERVFVLGMSNLGGVSPLQCDATGTCPVGQTCFHLTAELAICDLSQQTQSGQCSTNSTFPDACGCNGMNCGAEQVCVSVADECSCAPNHHNECEDRTCDNPSDCMGGAVGNVCTPTSYILAAGYYAPIAHGRCFFPECTSDADCAGGRCALILSVPVQGGSVHMSKVGCVFDGAASCPNVTAQLSVAGQPGSGGFTACY